MTKYAIPVDTLVSKVVNYTRIPVMKPSEDKSFTHAQ